MLILSIYFQFICGSRQFNRIPAAGFPLISLCFHEQQAFKSQLKRTPKEKLLYIRNSTIEVSTNKKNLFIICQFKIFVVLYHIYCFKVLIPVADKINDRYCRRIDDWNKTKDITV